MPAPPPQSGAPATGRAAQPMMPGGAGRSGLVSVGMPPRRVLADSDGRFVFRDLPQGTYSVSTQLSGYLGGSFGQKRPGGSSTQIELSDGERDGGVAIKMWKFAVVTGTVLDEAGEPIIGVQVRALRRTLSGGKRRLQQSGGQGTTDDRGIYRLSNLTPGEYVLVMPTTQTTMPVATIDAYQLAMQKGGPASAEWNRAQQESGAPYPDSSGTRVGNFVLQSSGFPRSATAPTPTEDGRVLSYPTVFYPEATTSARAAVITVASGEEKVGVDFQLRLVPTVRISGTVTGPDGPAANLGLHLVPADSDDQSLYEDVATTVVDPEGKFSFLGVPAGAYIIRATRIPRPTAVQVQTTVLNGVVTTLTSRGAGPGQAQQQGEPTLWASMPVATGDTDVTGIAISLRTGLKVTGRLEFDGSSPKPTAQQLQQAQVRLSAMDVQFNGPTPSGRVETDGQFTTGGFPPGRYMLSAGGSFGQNWILKSVMIGGRNAADSPFDLEGDVTGAIVTFTDRPAALSGTVRSSTNGEPDPNAMVILFPTDNREWTGGQGLHMRALRTNKLGAFNMPRMLAGDYYLVAISEEQAADWQDPKFLQSLAGLATQIRLTEGDKHTQDLRTAVVR
jgi:hypothetical protein